jgi:hypothetical protein
MADYEEPDAKRKPEDIYKIQGLEIKNLIIIYYNMYLKKCNELYDQINKKLNEKEDIDTIIEFIRTQIMLINVTDTQLYANQIETKLDSLPNSPGKKDLVSQFNSYKQIYNENVYKFILKKILQIMKKDTDFFKNNGKKNIDMMFY